MKENSNMNERKKRLIGIDQETGEIFSIESLDYTENDPTKQCIIRRRHFRPRWDPYPSEVGSKKCSYDYCYQKISKMELFLTNSK